MVEGDPVSFHASPSGQRLVYATTRMESLQLQIPAISDVWVLELQSGQQQKLVSFPPHDGTSGAAGSQVHLIGWLDAK